jgi:hypothetical protein
VTASPEVIAAACAYMASGYAIVPALADKKPLGNNWRSRGSPEQVAMGLRDPNVVAIGFLGGDLNHGIVPLDFDTEKGERWWRRGCEAAGIDPDDFPTCITPGKLRSDGSRNRGRHRYVTDTRGTLTNSQGRLLRELGIDVRGRGHAMLPPSPHPDGGCYAWVPGRSRNDFPDGIPACPDFIYDAIAAGREPTHEQAIGHEYANGYASHAAPRSDDSASGYCQAALENASKRVADAREGKRNQALNDAALGLGHLAHHGAFSEDEVRAALWAACEANGLVADDGAHAFEATFNSGWKKGVSEPKEIPDRPCDHRHAERREEPRAESRASGTEGPAASEPQAPEEEPDVGNDAGLGEWDAGEDTEPIPPRGWLLGNTFCRRFVSSLQAGGGAGKTALRVVQALAMATGRSLTGEHVFRRCRVLLLSLEDDRDELRRRVAAAMKHHGISRGDLRGWLFLATPAAMGWRLAAIEDGKAVPGELGPKLEEVIRRRQIDVVILDPLMKAHAVAENSNEQIDLVAGILARIAADCDCAIDAPHHIAKGAADPGNADRGRGASAFKDGARLVYSLAPMTPDEAETFGVGEADRRLLVRMDSAKVNIAPPAAKAAWFKLVGVELGNGNDAYPAGDNVQTVESWTPPDAWKDLNRNLIHRIIDDIDKGLPDGRRYSDSPTAGEDIAAWRVVQKHAPSKTEPEAKAIIRTWVKNGVLVPEEYVNPVRRTRAKGLKANPAKRPS